MVEFLFTLAFGSLLGAGFFWWILQGQEHSDTVKSASGLVNWDYLEEPQTEGIIRLEDGGLLASYRYRGKDLNSASESQRAHLSERLNTFFKGFENDYGFFFSMMRKPASGYPSGEHFPDPVTYGIDQERREKNEQEGQHYRSEFYLSIVWRPGFRPTVDAFLTELEGIEDKLEKVLYPTRLSGGEHLSLLYRQMHGIDQPVTPPKQKEPINDLLANQDIQVLPIYQRDKHPVKSALNIPDENIVIDGDQYIRTITITGYPNRTYNGVLNELNQLKAEYRWTTRIFTMDRRTQEKKIKKARDLFRMARYSFWTIITGSMTDGAETDDDVEEAYKDLHSISKMRDSSEALAKVADRSTSFAVSTSTITLISEDLDRLKQDTRNILSCLREAGFTGQLEKFQSRKAWIGSLPGQAENNRKEFVSTYNIADMLPTWSMWTGRDENPGKYMRGASAHFLAKTIGNEPFKKHRPAASGAGHSIIVGKTGGGKSVYANFEIAQWRRHKNAQIFLFDVGYSGHLLCEAAGGEHHDIMNSDSFGFQPLRDMSPEALNSGKFYNHWVEDLFYLQEQRLSSKEKNKIGKALAMVAEEPPEARTLTQLSFHLQDNKLKETIKLYTRDGNYGNILDASKDTIGDSSYQVFEIGDLVNEKDEIKIPIFMYLFHKIEQSLHRTRPTLIYIEEAWAAFQEEHFQDRLSKWMATLRKHNGHVTLVTHTPEQINELSNPDAFLINIPESVFLPNKKIKEKSVRKVYDRFSLNESQIQTISNIDKQKEYYVVTPDGSGAIDLELLPLSLGFIGEPSDLGIDQRKEKINELKHKHGRRWPIAWLEFVGMPEEAEKLKQIYNHPKFNKSTTEVA